MKAKLGIASMVSALLLGGSLGESRGAEARFTVSVGGGSIALSIDEGEFDLSPEEIRSWVETCARAVTAYYGAFPVKEVRLRVHPSRGRRVGSGVTHGGDSPRIDIEVGARATRATLKEDWVLTHEMVHLAFPDMDEKHRWIEEGLASYIEPFARLRIGELTPEKVWGDLVRGLPQGLPREGDHGLDRTHTWGRTYWGGALFCLLADVEIREATQNTRGLEDALRGIQAAGGSIREDWTIARALEAGDRATGTQVLAKLYDAMKETPVATDLDALWKSLGVSLANGKVTFDDAAPLAATRKAIEHRRRWL